MFLIKLIIRILLFYLVLSLAFSADKIDDKPILITQETGAEIDLAERNKYGLFLSIKNFESAQLHQTPGGKYIFIVKYYDEQISNSTTRKIEITEEDLQKIRSRIENSNKILEPDSSEANNREEYKPQMEFLISRAYLITKNFEDDVDTRELFFSLERYYTVLGVGINLLLTTYYYPIISANICAAYPREFPLTPYISGGFCLFYPLFLNYSAGLKLSLHKHLAIRLEYRAWYALDEDMFFEESFYIAGLNISF